MSWLCFRCSRKPLSPPVLEYEVHYRLGQMMNKKLIAFVGSKGSGRNTLAWRFKNLEQEGPSNEQISSLFKRHVFIDLTTRPSVHSRGQLMLDIRIVPPELNAEGCPFFSRSGEIQNCAALVFCFDIADTKSSDDFYVWMNKARHSLDRMPPFLIVGNKVDQRSFRITISYNWAKGLAELFGAREYLECSAKYNDRVDRVLDTILNMVL
ncbi:uncharacterized protein TNIN_421271 [Trichonephila inaurata madagascariensis]|uniref:Uncharacterized protein n=1 Tax=Trichonephila inaurata madagascariensis TaxID=2747483 RepID=A0A8X7CKD0_9ARAC|nr:uncharacterized protein TNIN_421271 [Trichonephila inaurata madagascariensis]